MKKYKYKVIYLNGNEETFTANGFAEAIVKAMTHAHEMAWDWRIKFVTDEKGETVKNIQPPTFEHSK